ncbi:MAG: hypothetical protein AB8I08_21065 [Sandaracinaceae bacterium]
MPNRKSGTYRRNTDPRTARGKIVVVGRNATQSRALSQYIESPAGVGVPTVMATGLTELQRLIHPAHHRPVGRRRVRGFLIHFQLTSADGGPLGLLKWLGAIYPRTPVVVYTNASQETLSRASGRDAEFVSAAELDAQHGEGGAFREAMLGVLELSSGSQVMVLRQAEVGADVLEACNQQLFQPWDERCIALRRWLLEEARESAPDLKEYHLCTLDAYFDSLAVSELATARGISRATLDQNLKEIRALYQVADIDVLRGRWERDWFGRGARSAAIAPWLKGRRTSDAETLASARSEEARRPSRPPSARSGRRVRSTQAKLPAAERTRAAEGGNDGRD